MIEALSCLRTWPTNCANSEARSYVSRTSSRRLNAAAEALERGIVAINALFADIEQDVDARDLLDQAIEGDPDAEAPIAAFAERVRGISAGPVGAIIDARRFDREQRRGRIREIVRSRGDARKAETGAAGYNANGATVQAGAEARELEALGQEPGEVADEDYDRYLQFLEQLNNDRIHGLAEMPEWAERQLKARLKQANEVRRGVVKRTK